MVGAGGSGGGTVNAASASGGLSVVIPFGGWSCGSGVDEVVIRHFGCFARGMMRFGTDSGWRREKRNKRTGKNDLFVWINRVSLVDTCCFPVVLDILDLFVYICPSNVHQIFHGHLFVM